LQPASITFRVWCFEHVVACARNVNVLLAYLHNFRYKLNVRYLVEILVLQIAAKQLQLATWLLLTAYRNLPTPYPTVPSPTPYDVPFSRNTKRYRQTTDRRTEHRTISATVLPSIRSAKNLTTFVTVFITAFSLLHLRNKRSVVYNTRDNINGWWSYRPPWDGTTVYSILCITDEYIQNKLANAIKSQYFIAILIFFCASRGYRILIVLNHFNHTVVRFA